MLDFFSPKGLLAKHLLDFEPREGQRAMAEAVTDIIQGTHDFDQEYGRLLVVEAETGIGKTLAYLVPAIESGQRVVISTATLNLQDQIMNKEIPLIEAVFGKKISALCIKGRQNYLCLYRWYQYRASGQQSLFEEEDIESIDDWLITTETGDRAELEWLSERSPLWPKISAHSNQCLGGDCPEGPLCFINQLRKQAGSASVLIVNHHLFFSDLALRQAGFGEVLPRYEGVIFDEAHHIEQVATSFFGRSFSQYQLIDLLADIERQAENDLDPQGAERIGAMARGLKTRTEEFASLFPAITGKYHLKEFLSQFSLSAWRSEVELLARGIERMAEEAGLMQSAGESWATFESRALELRSNLLSIALPDSLVDDKDEEEGKESGFVYWYERRERSVAISATPIHVDSLLQRTLYRTVEWCVMTSATLSSGGDFSYMRRRLGLDESLQFLQFPSPFDYENRTLLYIPPVSFPEPSDQNFPARIGEQALEILKLSKGRGLVLCTSFRGMESLAAHLEQELEYPVLVQGRGARNALLKTFRETNNSVLVAVASFWEGVDVQGEALSCVIIDKLPFEVPSDPVIQARIEAIKELGGNPFFEFQVPRAILTLRQGVGRLMRAATDSGVIAIMDVRLFTKGYGRRFRQSLPPSPVVRKLSAIENFFASAVSDTE